MTEHVQLAKPLELTNATYGIFIYINLYSKMLIKYKVKLDIILMLEHLILVAMINVKHVLGILLLNALVALLQTTYTAHNV